MPDTGEDGPRHDDVRPGDPPLEGAGELVDGLHSRRTFVRRAGAVGAASLIPGWLAACGSNDSGGNASSGGGGGGGPALKIGYVTPGTGALAAFAEADSFILDGVRDRFSGGIATKKARAKSRSSSRTRSRTPTAPARWPAT